MQHFLTYNGKKKKGVVISYAQEEANVYSRSINLFCFTNLWDSLDQLRRKYTGEKFYLKLCLHF